MNKNTENVIEHALLVVSFLMFDMRKRPILALSFYEKLKQQGGIGLIGDSRRAKQLLMFGMTSLLV